jgi:hypothetical protein
MTIEFSLRKDFPCGADFDEEIAERLFAAQHEFKFSILVRTEEGWLLVLL